MKLLIDECVPRKFKFNLTAGGHVCSTVQEAGFAGKKNGELLRLADVRLMLSACLAAIDSVAPGTVAEVS